MIRRTSKFRFPWTLLWLLVTLALGLTGGVVLDRRVLIEMSRTDTSQSARLDVSLINEAWNLIQQDYVDRSAIQPRALTYGAISGMTDALGDTGHTRFLSPEMVKQENNFDQGQFEGIGAEVQTKDGHVVIVAPFDGSPAQRAGLVPGDIILKVNGQDVTGMPLSQAINLIVGPAGTSVTLTIFDPNGTTREIALVRARIAIHNVTWQRLPGTTIAHVHIAAFSSGVTQDLRKALQDIQAQKMTGVILDLRNDPGGLLDEAVGTVSQFLSSGNALEEKNARGQITKVGIQSGGAATSIPIVVLINNGTASAAEIVSGALQDAHRSKLFGETTFGTGTVLNPYMLSDGSELLLATEEWLTPSGRVIWHKGISPDVAVSLPVGASPLDPEIEQDLTPAQLRSSGDTQLLQALDSLTQTGQP